MKESIKRENMAKLSTMAVVTVNVLNTIIDPELAGEELFKRDDVTDDVLSSIVVNTIRQELKNQ